uniref:efflux RND transporter periplasmic adaptor subunit n=1 Tax=Salibaculum halophilum TaxID=1914408 RepID=UPI001179FED1
RTEAEARLEEARINQNAAARLSEDGFASETRLANAEAALASARAGLTSAEAAVEGAQAGISSAEASVEGAKAGVEAARAGIQSAQAAVAAAERELERLDITAPFAGLLESDTAELGSLMQPGSPCATVIQLDPIKLVGFVPEADVAKVETGAMAGAELSSGDRVQGPVTFLSRSADPATRTFRVEIEVPNPDLDVRDGQTAEILIEAEGRSAHRLAASSMTLNDDGDIGVRVVDDADVARFLPVTVLRDTAQGVLVTGLPDSVDVIVVGQEYVRDGVPVAPTYREANG